MKTRSKRGFWSDYDIEFLEWYATHREHRERVRLYAKKHLGFKGDAVEIGHDAASYQEGLSASDPLDRFFNALGLLASFRGNDRATRTVYREWNTHGMIPDPMIRAASAAAILGLSRRGFDKRRATPGTEESTFKTDRRSARETRFDGVEVTLAALRQHWAKRAK